MINIVCFGKIKENYLNSFIDDYSKRIEKYHKIKIIEFKDTNNLKEEATKIQKYINSNDYVIACTIEGRKIDSVQFAKLIDTSFIKSGTITFIIGSSNGLDEEIKKKSDLCLSFSDMTMPHGLFRGILLEQIYRSFKINNNESYHK